MKLRRKISIWICCMAVMGMFSVNILPVRAAECTHKFYMIQEDVTKYAYQKADGHYEMRGTLCQCPCGYSWWENLGGVKVGDHTWIRAPYKYEDGTITEQLFCNGCGKYKFEVILH